MAEKEKAMKAEEKAKAEKQKKEVDPEESERAVNSEKEQDVQADAVKELEQKLALVNDKYLRLSAEFDNYRTRTLKEKMELTKNAGEQILSGILPVVDNFERALASMEKSDDMQAIREGVKLIYNSFKEFLTQNGVTEIDCVNNTFDTDEHEAVTKIPAPSADLKGKVVDCIQKGYKLNDKVMRFAKVVVGE
ncbi:MAG: nucleotide exchange factor GrpE [Odoribacter splanchnicus]